MSKRLASFHGPSTPTSSPIPQPRQPGTPASPSRASENTIHRKVRTLLQELRSLSHAWDDLVLVDGLRAVRTLVDTRTELDNALALLAPGSLPRSPIVGPKLAMMEKCIVQLDSVLTKLQKNLRRMGTVVDNLEALYHEAQKTKGPKWCKEEPLWLSWSIEKFVLSMGDITTPYHRSLVLLTDLVNKLRSHSLAFEASRDIVNQWVEQPYLEENGWDVQWEDLCAAEVEKWDARL
ncbi:hypothetical protein BKA82DRAFT_1008209 [Pisolithus tinctorius]|uniref:Uncharacterized protein n=1 Tax=Pisolithus tinctorius Marx 270 TaxID=870435 RepID=A0A0C3NFP8_PISTI|nr:hypothetical protein BKA82DRAFT_1008209 [Pisolithus tinctorius]KIN94600.1 hypothetical protein M404DRAFT_1008209 [Pisolithus tinctorius Marx 270]